MRFILAALLVILPAAVQADEVLLDDGSRLVGTVNSIREGVLTLQTQHAGKLSIKMSGVRGIVTDEERGIAQTEDTPEVGRLESDGEAQTLVKSDGSAREIATDSILLLWPAENEMPEPKPLWSGRLEFGFSGADGNSERTSVLGRAQATRETDVNLIFLYSSADYAENNDVRTRNELKIGGRYEWKLNGPWSAFTRAEFEHDEFEEVDLRSTGVVGLGYEVLNTERQELNARFGVGYQNEDFEDGDSDSEAILDLGYDYALRISTWAILRHDLTYSSALEDPVEGFRVVANTGAEVPMGTGEAWKLRTGVTHEYDDDPNPGIESLDTTYFLNLAYDW